MKRVGWWRSLRKRSHPFPRIRGTQIGLKDPAWVDVLKIRMQAGLFAYEERDLRIGGVKDQTGVYHVIEGHHRMVAAMEIHAATGDATAVNELLRCGKRDEMDVPPNTTRPLPMRDWWGRLRNWLNF